MRSPTPRGRIRPRSTRGARRGRSAAARRRSGGRRQGWPDRARRACPRPMRSPRHARTRAARRRAMRPTDAVRTREVRGSTRASVPVLSLTTQTAPAPAAVRTDAGAEPDTPHDPVRRGSIRTSVPAPSAATQTAPKPAAAPQGLAPAGTIATWCGGGKASNDGGEEGSEHAASTPTATVGFRCRREPLRESRGVSAAPVPHLVAVGARPHGHARADLRADVQRQERGADAAAAQGRLRTQVGGPR